MKPKTSIEIEGTTVEEAIKKALSELGLSRDKVKITILFEGVKGLFGMPGAKPAKIRVTIIKNKEKT
jgi:spoIIIJ-associated protein